jgi:hypothetical protein
MIAKTKMVTNYTIAFTVACVMMKLRVSRVIATALDIMETNVKLTSMIATAMVKNYIHASTARALIKLNFTFANATMDGRATIVMRTSTIALMTRVHLNMIA